jgi:predicted DNA-binding transcriptional regulator AlpA
MWDDRPMHHLVGMAEIAEMLGVSRQRVAQLIETYEDFPKPEVELTGGRVWSRTAVESWIASHPERGPGRPEREGLKGRFFGRMSAPLFSRFTDRARTSIVRAQEEARLLGHNYIGTEHLLLGLIVIGEGLAYEALSGSGLTVDAVRTQVLEMIGRGGEQPQGHIPFTPRAKKVLEIALREAKHLGHNYIGTEHVLLALMREGDGVAPQALAALGHSPNSVRDATLEKMRGYGTTTQPPSEACSFCGKSTADVETLVSGPGDIAICNECIARSADIVREGDPIGDRLARIEQRLAELEGGED